MRMWKLALVLAAVSGAIATPFAEAQAVGFGQDFGAPRFDVSLGYTYIKANAPPSGCECFGLNGGYASVNYNVTDWLGVTGEFSMSHANQISNLGQNLTLATYMGGPKISLHHGRFVPFGQALFGEAHGSDSYFPTATSFTTTASSFALSAGGGLDINLTRRFAVRLPEVQYLRTSFPNFADNQQNQLMVSAGIVIKFGSREHWSSPAPIPAKKEPEITFSCSTNVTSIEQGDILRIMAQVETNPESMHVLYSWTTTGGTVTGGGRAVSLDTTGMTPGDYRITGSASLASSPHTVRTCDLPFHVSPAHATPPPTPTPALSDDAKDKEFHDNVPDALFDYDSYAIRTDAQDAIEHAADYLTAHPLINVIIAGYSDERGSAEYNLALGEKRANAVRESLIVAGIPGERLKVVSYGKETQVCQTQDEVCWQQNRRAAFAMAH